MSYEPIIEHDGLTITRPCRHGMNLDWTTETQKRVHLRLYVFEPGRVEGEWMELPAELTVEAALVYQRMTLEKLREAVLSGVFAPPASAVRDLVVAASVAAPSLTLLAVESAAQLRQQYGDELLMVRPRTVGFVEIELPAGARHLLPAKIWQDYQWAAVAEPATREVLP